MNLLQRSALRVGILIGKALRIPTPGPEALLSHRSRLRVVRGLLLRSREINDAALALHAASRENTALADHLLECKDLAGDPLEPLEPIPETIEDLAARELGWGDNASE